MIGAGNSAETLYTFFIFSTNFLPFCVQNPTGLFVASVVCLDNSVSNGKHRQERSRRFVGSADIGHCSYMYILNII